MKKGTTAWYFYGVDPRQNEIKRYALDSMHNGTKGVEPEA
jgi:hypothetical protein